MNMKKSLLALSTTTVVAIGGAGIAAADEPAGDTPTTTGPITNLPSGDAAGSLESFGDIAKNIKGIANAISAGISASSDFGDVVSDTLGFLSTAGN